VNKGESWNNTSTLAFFCIIGSNFAVASGLPKSIDGCSELDKLQIEPAEVVEKGCG
jgi:hypothetical protein